MFEQQAYKEQAPNSYGACYNITPLPKWLRRPIFVNRIITSSSVVKSADKKIMIVRGRVHPLTEALREPLLPLAAPV